MDRFELIIYGSAVPEGRARTQPIYTKSGPLIKNNRVIMSTYTPAKTKAWRDAVTMEAQRVVRESDYKMFSQDDALVMSIEAVYLRPKSVSAKKRPHHTVKPDLDNISKNIKDALSGVAYPDDKQVMGYVWPYIKRYSNEDEQPFTRIIVMQYEDWRIHGVI